MPREKREGRGVNAFKFQPYRLGEEVEPAKVRQDQNKRMQKFCHGGRSVELIKNY